MDDFERIYAEHFDIVYGYCLKLTHDPHQIGRASCRERV